MLRRSLVCFTGKGQDDVMRALVIEDDLKIASLVAGGLMQAGFAVDRAVTGGEGFDLGQSVAYDLAIVDVMLPDQSGLSVIEAWRARRVMTPVIILSARRSVDDRVRGLQAGGDDYLTKPFSITELVARARAMLRRSSTQPEATRLSAGDLTLDLISREASRGGTKIVLQPREFSLLEVFLRHAGQPVTKSMILEKVWNYSFDPGSNVVDVLVSRLRGRIDKGFATSLIHTVRGVGYVLRSS